MGFYSLFNKHLFHWILLIFPFIIVNRIINRLTIKLNEDISCFPTSDPFFWFIKSKYLIKHILLNGFNIIWNFILIYLVFIDHNVHAGGLFKIILVVVTFLLVPLTIVELGEYLRIRLTKHHQNISL